MMQPLVIRAEQMTVLSRYIQRQWLDAKLTELYPPFAAMTENERLKWIDGGLKRAARFRLRPEDSLAFLCFEQTFGEGCCELPEYHWAKQIIEDPAIDPEQRMRHLKKAAIRRLLDEEDRQAAEAQARAEAEQAKAGQEGDIA